MRFTSMPALRSLLAVMTLLLLGACSSLPAPASKFVGGWSHLGSEDFESKRPGLGRSESYGASYGWITVYHYGLGRRDWRNGVSDPGFAQQFELTMAEVRYHESRGDYRAVSFEPVRDLQLGTQAFRAVRFYFFSRGEAMRSVTYLSVYQGQLLKFRVTMPTTTGGDIDQLTQQFILGYMGQPPAAQQPTPAGQS